MYQAKETRYDKMVYNRCGNSGLKTAKFPLDSGTISEIPEYMKICGRWYLQRLTMVSHILIWPIITDRSMEVRKQISENC